jgi:hypothetical protein
MKYLSMGVMLLAVGALVGCQDGRSPAGGPGATKGAEGVRVTNADNTFKIDVPNTETEVKQGQKQTVRIGINRGKAFDQEVKLEFKGAPKGVKVSPESVVVKPDMKEATVTVEGAPEAALGEFKITVTGTPMREGTATSADFQVEVKKSD